MKLKQLFDWLYANKRSLASTIGSALLSTAGSLVCLLTDVLPTIDIGGFDCAPILGTVICIAIFVLNELGITGRGFETVVDFMAKQQLISEEQKDKLLTKQAQREIKRQEKLQAEAESKARQQALIEERIKELSTKS